MSGGVDSSVAAALLKKSGFLVAGVFMKCWNNENSGTDCPQLSDDEYTARRAAAKLKIPFYKFDFTQEYKQKVIDYFIREYTQGRTPNPDVMCNKEIKFGLFYEKAVALGFDFVATGHYSQIKNGGFRVNLLQGEDSQKDQSYFLYAVPPEKFEKIIFPIGEYHKNQVRKIAKTLGLPNAERKDSQGICFVGKVKLGDFLKDYIPEKPGKIITRDGKVLGEHSGVHFYTIGQRKGIKLPGGPYYVLGKDIKENLLIVTKNEKDLYKKELVAENVNWIPQTKLKFPLRLQARIRHLAKEVPAILFKLPDTNYKLLFHQPQRAIAPGQSVVFYQGKELIGGGTIK